MTPAHYALYGVYLAVWPVLIYAFIALRQSRRAFQSVKIDHEFIAWANRMMFSVTTEDGFVYAGTLREIHREGVMEQIWTRPIAVSLWHTDPDVHAPYRRAAQNLQAATRTDEKDQTT